MRKPFQTGVAFGAGFFLAPSLITALLFIAAAIVISLLMHWLMLVVIAVVIGVAMIVRLFTPPKEEVEAKTRSEGDWYLIHRREHLNGESSRYCPNCIRARVYGR